MQGEEGEHGEDVGRGNVECPAQEKEHGGEFGIGLSWQARPGWEAREREWQL